MRKRALISVFDKTGVVAFAQGLAELGWELVSTGGTARALREAGLQVIEISEVTGFPEILDCRVKTLHPRVHGAILARRAKTSHIEELGRHDIVPLDLIAVNLYPFEQTIAKPDVTLEDALENIDIGGVCLLRASAKNFEDVLIVSDPGDYGSILESLKKDGVSKSERLALAVKAFKMTAHYDTAICDYLVKIQ